MIHVPLKTTKPLKLRQQLEKHLTQKYGKDEVERQVDSITHLAYLRESVEDIRECSPKTREILVNYYYVIDKVQDKIPVSRTEVRKKKRAVWFVCLHLREPLSMDRQLPLFITWSDTLSPNSFVGQWDWNYEKANIMFCLASWETDQASKINRSVDDGQKRAAKHYTNASAIFDQLRQNVSHDLTAVTPYDLLPEALAMLSAIMLAQGQACYFERAYSMKMKPQALAKLAMGASKCYKDAKGLMTKRLNPVLEKTFDWGSHIDFQTLSFHAAACFQQSKTSFAAAEETGSNFGEEIAFLSKAERLLVKATNIAKRCNIPHSSAIRLLNSIRNRKAEAEDDNRNVYMSSIPEENELPDIERTVMAKLGSLPECPSDVPQIFSTLVPASVAKSRATFEEWRTDRARELRNELSDECETCRGIIASLHLPAALSVSEEKEKIPPQLMHRLELARISGVLDELKKLVQSNKSASSNLKKELKNIRNALEGEVEKDIQYRSQYADVWICASAEDVCKTQFAQLERYEKILQQAARADDQVGKKLDDNEVNLTLIGKTKQQLEAMVPYSETTRALSDECLTVKSELVKTLDELENFMIHRDEIVESHMFSSLSAEEVADELTRAGGSVQDKTIEKLKARMQDKEQKARTEFNDKKNRLLEKVESQYKRFKDLSENNPQNDTKLKMLQRIEDAVQKFEEINSNLKEGESFYSDLSKRVQQLRGEVSDLVAARDIERRETLMNLSTHNSSGSASSSQTAGLTYSMANMNVSATPPPEEAHPSSQYNQFAHAVQSRDSRNTSNRQEGNFYHSNAQGGFHQSNVQGVFQQPNSQTGFQPPNTQGNLYQSNAP